MPKKKYIVALIPSERSYLEQLTKKGKTAAYKMNHARILLKADINQKSCSVNWRFTTEDARIKLKRLYPSIQT